MTFLRWLIFLGSLTATLTLLLDLFISFDTSICSKIALPPLGNSDHVVVSVSVDFLSNLKWDAMFHFIADDCSCAD